MNNVNGGDNFSSSTMNNIKSELDLIYLVASSGYVNHGVANLFPYNEQDGQRDNTKDSRFTFVHKHRYLLYSTFSESSNAIIVDPSGLNENTSLNGVKIDEYGEYDLDSITWLSVGMLYQLREVLWAVEVQKGDYLYG